MQCDVGDHPQLPGEQVGRARLVHSAGDAVQHVPDAGRRCGDERLLYQVEHDLVGHRLAAVEMLLDGSAELCVPRHVITEQVTRRDMGMRKWAAINAPCVPLPAPGGAIISTRILVSSSRPPRGSLQVSASVIPVTGTALVGYWLGRSIVAEDRVTVEWWLRATND